jgi:hypothetical protein
MNDSTPATIPPEIRDICERIVGGTIAPREGSYEVMREVGPDLLSVDDHPLWDELREFYSVLDQWEDSENLRKRLGEEMPEDLIQTYERMIIDDARRIVEGREPPRLG